MSAEYLSQREAKFCDYIQIWVRSIAGVLGEVTGTPFTAQEITAEKTIRQFNEPAEQSLSVRFELAQSLTGEHGVLLSKEDGLRLAQLLLGEPQDPAKEFTEEHRDAFDRFFRQFAGAAAVSLKGLAGGEVNVQFSGLARLQAVTDDHIGYELNGSKLPPLSIFMEISPPLRAALRPEISASAPASTPVTALEPSVAPSCARDPKLDLLLDVELDVTLRFGARQMLLHDVLELNAGSVVELDQHVQDPVELLVGGKVIARGEVVVVDGNYGLRVSEIVSPMERIESLRG